MVATNVLRLELQEEEPYEVTTWMIGALLRAEHARTEEPGGDLLATIRDERDEILQEVYSSTAGTILGLRSKAFIDSENWAILVGKSGAV